MKTSLGKFPLALCLLGFALALVSPAMAGRNGNAPPPPTVFTPKQVTSQP